VPLTDREAGVVEAIAGKRDELVALASTLVGFDTTARDVGDPARQETELQEHLAARLREHGAEIDLFEPDAAALHGKPLVPDGIDFASDIHVPADYRREAAVALARRAVMDAVNTLEG